MDLEDIELLIKSCVISKKGGVLVSQINRDFAAEAGEPIPFRKFGYNSLEGFLRSLKDVEIRKNPSNETVLVPVVNDKTAHIISLVQKQKTVSKKKRSPRSRGGQWKRSPTYPPKPLSTQNRSRSSRPAVSSYTKSPSASGIKQHYPAPSLPRIPLSENSNCDIRGLPYIVYKNSDDAEQKEKTKENVNVNEAQHNSLSKDKNVLSENRNSLTKDCQSCDQNKVDLIKKDYSDINLRKEIKSEPDENSNDLFNPDELLKYQSLSVSVRFNSYNKRGDNLLQKENKVQEVVIKKEKVDVPRLETPAKRIPSDLPPKQQSTESENFSIPIRRDSKNKNERFSQSHVKGSERSIHPLIDRKAINEKICAYLKKEERKRENTGCQKLKSIVVTVSKNDKREVRQCTIPLTMLKPDRESVRPSVNGFELFGDDFFLSYANWVLDSYPSTFERSFHMMRKRLTLRRASELLHSQRQFPKKVVVLVGATDILAGSRLEDIAYDLYTLINDLLQLVEEIVLCTVPPLFSENGMPNLMEDLLKVNELIKCIPEDSDHRVRVIDLYKAFTQNTSSKRMLDFYCLETLKWSARGCELVKNVFEAKLCI